MTRKGTHPNSNTNPFVCSTESVKTKQEQLPTQRLSELTNSKAQEAFNADGQKAQESQRPVNLHQTTETTQTLDPQKFRKYLEAKHGHSMTKEAIEGVIRSLNKPRKRNDRTALLFRYGDLYDDSYDGSGGEWPDRK